MHNRTNNTEGRRSIHPRFPAQDMRLSFPASGDKLDTLAFRRGGAKAAHSSAVEPRSSMANAGGKAVPNVSCSVDLELILPRMSQPPLGRAASPNQRTGR